MRLCFLAILLTTFITATTQAQMGPAQVNVAPVEKRAIELTQPLVASVMPVTSTVVAAEQEGIIESRNFDEGQTVEAGVVLTRVNTDLLEIQLEAADAAHRTAMAELQSTNAELENAQREVVRITQLFESRVAPEKEYSDALTLRDISAAAVATRTARVAERAAEVSRLRTMLAKAETRSPLAGVIARRHVEIGEWINRGDAIADLLQLDPLFVEVNVPEEVIARVRRGDSARVEIDALGRRSFVGKIDQIVPLAEAASRTFRVKILLPNPDLEIWPGFFARAVLVSESAGAMLLVPRDSLVTREGSTYVVAVRDGVAAIVPVEVGPAQGDRLAVTGALREGEMVVIRGNEMLAPGMPVVVLNPPGGAASPTTRPQETSTR